MLQRKKSVAAGVLAASAVGSWVVVAALLLAGCGQKGPLMLPKPADAAASAPAASAPR